MQEKTEYPKMNERTIKLYKYEKENKTSKLNEKNLKQEKQIQS